MTTTIVFSSAHSDFSAKSFGIRRFIPETAALDRPVFQKPLSRNILWTRFGAFALTSTETSSAGAGNSQWLLIQEIPPKNAISNCTCEGIEMPSFEPSSLTLRVGVCHEGNTLSDTF